MNFLDNGSVLPSGLLSVNDTATLQAMQNTFNNKSLKAGIVVKSYMPGDPESFSGIIPEYDVLTIEQNGNLGVFSRNYRHCVSAQGLGSIADFFEYTLRQQTKSDKTTQGKDFAKQDGAIVLLLCLDGNEEKGVIVGCLRHPDRPTKLTEDNIMAGEFNGLSINVKKDGAAEVNFKGATDNQGKALDESLGNTTVGVEKDGSLQIKHKTITQRLDKQGIYSLTSDKDQTNTTKESFSVSAGKSFLVKATDSISMETKDAIMKMSGSLEVNAQTIKMQGDTEISLKTQAFKVEASGNAKIRSSMITLDGLTFVGGAGGVPVLKLGTIIYGIGALGVPVISQGISNFSTKTFVV